MFLSMSVLGARCRALLAKLTCALIITTISWPLLQPPVANASGPRLAVDASLLQREIITRLQQVPEFNTLRQLAQQHKINKLYLFGGTAAAWAHYVRWSLEHENQTTQSSNTSHTLAGGQLAPYHNFEGTPNTDHPPADKISSDSVSVDSVFDDKSASDSVFDDKSASDSVSVDSKFADTSPAHEGPLPVALNSKMFDYNLSSIVRWHQDVDLVIDHPDHKAVAAFEKDLNLLQASKLYELRRLHHEHSGKEPLANNKDFLNQNTDSLSTTLIELYSNFEASLLPKTTQSKTTQPKSTQSKSTQSKSTQPVSTHHPPNFRDKFIDLRRLDSGQRFLTDIVSKRISCDYDPAQHQSTSRYQKGYNPDIFFAIRVLNKVFQHNLQLDADCYQIIKSIFHNFDASTHLITEYARYWLNKNAKKLYQNALDLELAHSILKDLGALKKLQNLDKKQYEALVLLMNRQPLLSRPLIVSAHNNTATKVEHNAAAAKTDHNNAAAETVHQKSKLNHSQNSPLQNNTAATPNTLTARELGLQYVTHCTRWAQDYESITSSPTLQANVFISRPDTEYESAVYGPGFYTRQGLYTDASCYGRWYAWFRVDPWARAGVDFKVIGNTNATDNIIVFKNKAALQLISNINEYDVDFQSIEMFKTWALQPKNFELIRQSFNSSITQSSKVYQKIQHSGYANIEDQQTALMQSRFRRHVIEDFKHHPEKRKTLQTLADNLLRQHIQSPHQPTTSQPAISYAASQPTASQPAISHAASQPTTAFLASARLAASLSTHRATINNSLIQKNFHFWSSYFQLPFDDLSIDFLAYFKHLAQDQSLPYEYYRKHHLVREAMHQKMYLYFQNSKQSYQQLVQLARQQAQKKLSFLKNQNFWLAYLRIDKNLDFLAAQHSGQDSRQGSGQAPGQDTGQESGFASAVVLNYFKDLVDQYTLHDPPYNAEELYSDQPYNTEGLHTDQPHTNQQYASQNLPHSLPAAASLEAHSDLYAPQNVSHNPPTLPYLHVDIETVLLNQVMKDRALKYQLQQLARRFIQHYPPPQALVFWLSFVRLPFSVHLGELILGATKKTENSSLISRFSADPRLDAAQKNKNRSLASRFSLVLEGYPHWQKYFDGELARSRVRVPVNVGAPFGGTRRSRVRVPVNVPQPTHMTLDHLININLYSLDESALDSTQMALALGFDVDRKNYGKTALMWASTYGLGKTVQFLLAAGADFNLEDDVLGETSFAKAVFYDQSEILKLFLDAGADPNVGRSFEPFLIYVARTGRIKMLADLLAAGANPNLQNNIGQTALVLAIQEEKYEAAQLILPIAQLDLQDAYGNTALILAAYKNQYDLVKALLDHGAQPDLQDKAYGETALIKAAQQRHHKIVKLLLQAGADPGIKSKSGQRALDMVPFYSRSARLLRAATNSVKKQKNTTRACARLLGRKSP